MLFSKPKILEYLQTGKLAFSPELDAYQLQPDSVDLRLGTTFYIPETWQITAEGRLAVRADYVDVKTNPEYFKMIKLKPGQYFELLPQEFIIISTLERVTMGSGDFAATLYPRSSVLRRGLIIEGGVVDACYDGYLTIPTLNSSHHSIRLYPGERVCHLIFHELSHALSADEAQLHGLDAAKYQSATPYGLDAKLDRQEEIEFIRAGKIEELKAAHPVVREKIENKK
ncbi:dCTP deaminase [Candidatus Uhrbacteria bacterium]|nr:dCTP deaminase [Candidatus Uhrbacteria bacterium]